MAVPEIRNYKLSEFFASTYRVPRYQRNYTWGDSEIGLFMDDITSFALSNDEYYLLGEAIAATLPHSDYDYELIDGQQRATTLMVLFAVLHKKLEDLGASALQMMETTNALYQGEKGIRVSMSGNASEAVVAYLNGTPLEHLVRDTRSKENVVAAFEVIINRLDEALPEADKETLINFSNRVIGKVYLGRLTLESVEQATDFFERVNNRGSQLTNADLLKNRLLQNIASESDYQWAAETWSEAERNLMNKGKLGSIEFLLRQLRQASLRVKVQEGELYAKTKELVSSEDGCLKLVDLISSKHKALANLLLSKSPSNDEDAPAQETSFFNFTQGLGVKLAASHLSPAQFAHLSKRLTARSILSLLAAERSQSFEKLVPIWSNEISKLTGESEFEEIDKALAFEPRDIKELLDVAEQRHFALRYDGTPGQVKRIRYTLAKDNFLVNQRAATINFSMKDFLTTSKHSKKNSLPGFDIDHIFPKSSEAAGEYVHKIGNLTLLHSTDNASAGASEPVDKSTIYSYSKAVLTLALTRKIELPPKVESAIAPYRVASIDNGELWTEKEYEARSLMYWQIIHDSLVDDLGVDINLS